MIRIGLLCAALSVPCTALAQSLADLAQNAPGPTERPRAVEIFAQAQGYTDLTADRFGPPAQPFATEMGAILLLRMFRNICLGLERGAPLETVLPASFAAYETGPYMMGDTAPGTGSSLVLSPTGSIDADEADGHPTVWLRPGAGGVICRLEWQIATDIPEPTQANMAQLLLDWLPWEFALVRASRPTLLVPRPLFDLSEWDRPCGSRWCPMTVTYNLPRGSISMETTLAIPDIEGTQ